MDMKLMTTSEDIYVKMAGKDVEAIVQKRLPKFKKKKQKIISAIIWVLSSGILILCLAIIIYRWEIHKKGKIKEEIESDAINSQHDEEDLELPLFGIDTVTSAANNFSTDNLLGRGGFGPVYKLNVKKLEDEISNKDMNLSPILKSIKELEKAAIKINDQKKEIEASKGWKIWKEYQMKVFSRVLTSKKDEIEETKQAKQRRNIKHGCYCWNHRIYWSRDD
nr:G-type lectin S-receptor-like serine/threonine-protein kinase At4g03230 isoform X1 [Arachis hypogaea]XP_025694336.1 G-type lectin S-receptor-like serine/threonine-protein kinase At4g03230 isoform X1 [Arachis hypogaea]XP_025694337.1 G-type lectin S-receptor-like serine/threonine-protein kinase At4g03230 isoform X1 [Arachis hypogaea]XP_029153601.1 G-type lectin S-receptor-like serine/threonine-protein kinase At4g03230 isoform X1 [Arachis hypogaea]